MIKIFKKSADILFSNLIFIQPMLLLFIIVSAAVSYALVNLILPFPMNVIFFLSIALIITAFFSGWLYINKYGVMTYNENDSREEKVVKSLQNFKKFLEGIGSGFGNVLIIYLALFVVYFISFYLGARLFSHYFSHEQFAETLKSFATASTAADVVNLLNAMTPETQRNLCYLLFFFNMFSVIAGYFSTVAFAVYSFDNVNVFKVLWRSLKFSLINIIPSVAIIIYTYILYVFLSVISLILSPGPISFSILIILLTLYFNYYIIIVFLFYYEQTQTKNNSNNGSELIG